ncbi:MAG TPA: hypothetical protein VL651_04250 [Bacteroidia bacterium]|nr:hypothetical protein [Bacteroidia bacterium]
MSALISTVLLLFPLLHSQNLILNPGFEDHGDAGVGGTQLKDVHVPGWSDPTTGTSDIYFYPNGDGASTFPVADSGSCYGAFYGSADGHYWGEYLQGTLTTPLVKNSVYRFSFAFSVYEKTGDDGMNVANYVGVSFSDQQRSNLAPLANAIRMKPDIVFTDQKSVHRNGRWTVFYQDYTAHGGEKHFILGTFNPKGVQYENDYDRSTYCFADNFSLVSTRAPGPIPDWVFANDSARTGMNEDHFPERDHPGERSFYSEPFRTSEELCNAEERNLFIEELTRRRSFFA